MNVIRFGWVLAFFATFVAILILADSTSADPDPNPDPEAQPDPRRRGSGRGGRGSGRIGGHLFEEEEVGEEGLQISRDSAKRNGKCKKTRLKVDFSPLAKSNYSLV